MVQMAGIEPARFIQPQDFKSCASTSSATSAYNMNWICLTTIVIIILWNKFVNTFLKNNLNNKKILKKEIILIII